MLLTRQKFMGSSSASIASAALTVRSFADERPVVTNPRATDGDQAHQPNWDEKLTITVGRQNADRNGQDDRVLQAAVDYVARAGGGTVKILPGVFQF